MLAIGFVPNRVNVDADFTRLLNRQELGLALVSEPIAGAERVSLDSHK